LRRRSTAGRLPKAEAKTIGEVGARTGMVGEDQTKEEKTKARARQEKAKKETEAGVRIQSEGKGQWQSQKWNKQWWTQQQEKPDGKEKPGDKEARKGEK